MIARMALNEEGEKVAGLADPGHKNFPDIKWDDIAPYWTVIVYEDDPETVLACLQIITSKPIGYVEFLGMDKSLTDMQRARVIKTIQHNAEVLMYAAGVYAIRSCIPFHQKQWKKVVKKHFGRHLFECNAFAMSTR